VNGSKVPVGLDSIVFGWNREQFACRPNNFIRRLPSCLTPTGEIDFRQRETQESSNVIRTIQKCAYGAASSGGCADHEGFPDALGEVLLGLRPSVKVLRNPVDQERVRAFHSKHCSFLIRKSNAAGRRLPIQDKAIQKGRGRCGMQYSPSRP
jgi:hypothetical protein